MNHWILMILMFYFTLVHVPGTHHMPDRLSRWKPQPGDKEKPEDDFEDWIDDINGFLHYLNLHLTSIHSILSTPPIASYIQTDSKGATNIQATEDQEQNSPMSYSIIP